ncbi:MAG: DUF4845 domain-containing protein [Gammaproteobacteria bacterium]|nr:DUF4845 domain-containing protein [Gammaproteobacteria bacterium]
MYNSNKQDGISAIGFLFILALIGIVTLVALRLYPAYMENFKVAFAMDSLSTQADIGEKRRSEIIDMLVKRLDVDNVDHVKPANIEIKPGNNGGFLLGVKYEIRGNLVGNLDFVVRFDKTVELR